MYRNIEIWVNDDRISVSFRGRTVTEFCIEKNSSKLFRRNVEDDEIIQDFSGSLIDLEKISVDVITFENSKDTFMALPKAHRRVAKTEKITPAKAAKRVDHDRNFDSISDTESKLILNEILASLKNNPHQTKTERSKETHRIAAKLNVKPMAVAGVRANMTRGVYGKIDA